MDKPLLRRTVFRLLILLLLAASPILFPVLLLWSERRLRLADLREFYAHVWGLMRRGYI